MRFNERCLIVGKTRSGKSTFALYLCRHFTGSRVVVVNVKGRLDVGVQPVHDPVTIDWRERVINFVPRSFQRELFEELYAEIWAHRAVPTVVWLDEASAITTPNYAPDHLLVVQQQGGEHNVGHVVVAQRCKNIKMELRTEAEELFIFNPPPSQADLEWLAEEIGEADGHDLNAYTLRRRLRDLYAHEGPHSFLWWKRATNELVDCAPLDPAWVGSPLSNVRAARREAYGQMDDASMPASAVHGDELTSGPADGEGTP